MRRTLPDAGWSVAIVFVMRYFLLATSTMVRIVTASANDEMARMPRPFNDIRFALKADLRRL